MDNYIDRFRNKVGLYTTIDSGQVDIISASVSNIEVYHVRLGKTIPSIFIPNYKEVADESIMYTYRTDDVQKGDYIGFLNDYHLVLDGIKDVKREGFIDSFRLIGCNVEFTYNGSTIRAYFKGSLRSMSSSAEEALRENLGYDLKNEALMIIPSNIITKENEDILVGGKMWRVVQIDDITNPDISYLGLEKTSTIYNNKVSSSDAMTTQSLEVNDYNTLKQGVIYEFTTEDGYINFNKTVEIISRTSTLIKAKMPLEIGIITVDYKESGNIVSKEYEVR